MATEARYLSGGSAVQPRYAAASALTPGEVLVEGERVVVVAGSKPIASGEDYSVHVDGFFEVECLSTDTPAVGALLYWDATNNRLTTTASTHKSAGLAVRAKSSGATKAFVDLNASVASATI